MARQIVVNIPDDIPEEWFLGQIETIILRWRLTRMLLKEIVEKSRLTEGDAEEIGERIKEFAWKKLKKRLGIRH